MRTATSTWRPIGTGLTVPHAHSFIPKIVHIYLDLFFFPEFSLNRLRCFVNVNVEVYALYSRWVCVAATSVKKSIKPVSDVMPLKLGFSLNLLQSSCISER